MLERIYPKFVSLLGAAGLASSLAYFAGAYLAFQPQWQTWAEFFVPAAIPLLLVPSLLLLAHLYLRTALGEWLLGRGHVDEAIAYCEERRDHNLVRSKKEALINRITLARAHMVRADYERADEVLSSGFARPAKGAEAIEIARWRLEAALRLEDLVVCHEAAASADGLTRPKRPRAYFLGCRAELAARQGDRSGFDEAIDEALWVGPKNPRVRLSQVFGALRFGASEDEFDEALALLEQVYSPTVGDVPHREGELVALRAEILWELGRRDEAREAIASAEKLPRDTRSDYEIRRVRERITDPSQTQSNPSCPAKRRTSSNERSGRMALTKPSFMGGSFSWRGYSTHSFNA